jgi:RNA polymerase sigma factor (sigma-70 family)
MVEDNSLIQQVLRGNQNAFQQLVERYQNYVFTLTFKILKSREEAEEAAQDVFLKVFRQLGSFEEKSKFSTWLYTIAYRTAIDYARRKKPASLSMEDDDTFLQIEDEVRRTPVQDLQLQDLRVQLKKAIQQLKPVDATIITLFYLHGLSVNEIAEIAELTVSNVKTKLHRLRETLRQQLSQQLKSEIQDLL